MIRISNISRLVCLSALLVACQREKAGLTIGAILPLTGDAASYGIAAQKGIDLAIDQMNATGGINGQKIQVVYVDTKGEPREGATAAEKLISVDHVLGIIGDITSGATLAAAPIAERSKVVLITPTGSAPAITMAGDYVFRNFPSDNLEGEVMADFLRKRGITRVAVLQVQNDYGEGIGSVFEDIFRRSGGTVVGHERYAQTTSDFRTINAKIRSQKPDAIYLVGYYKDAGLAIRQARELGIKVPVFATTTVEDPQFIQIGGPAVDGVIYPLSSGYDAASTDSVVKSFNERYQSKYGEAPGFVAAQAYDCARLLGEAFVLGGGIRGDSLQRGMTKVKNFPGAAGVTTFDANGDVRRTLRMRTVKDGKFIDLPRENSSPTPTPKP